MLHDACPKPLKVITDIVGFIVITSCTIFIGYNNVTYKGPSGNETYFYGYREENMIPLFVNLLASMAYYARIIANANCDKGFQMFTTLKYADYLTTCPMLVMDLLWNLEGPFKCTAAFLILATILTGVACSSLPTPQSYAWFAFGDVIFVVVYSFILVIVRERMKFFVMHAKTNRAVQAMYYVRAACLCFFGIWVWFPLIWILSPFGLNVISHEENDLVHMFLDVGAKSLYGVLLMKFRHSYDRKLLENLDDEEYKDFATTNPDRKATMRIRVEDSDSEHETAKEPPPPAPVRPKPDEPQMGRGPAGAGSRMLFASNRRNSNTGVTAVAAAGAGGGAGGTASPRRFSMSSRSLSLMLRESPDPSPRRTGSGEDPDGPDPGLYASTRSLHAQAAYEPGSRASLSRPAAPAGAWVRELARVLEEQGLGNPRLVFETVRRLEASGLSEHQMRTCVSDEDLRELGVDSAARRAVLAHFHPSPPRRDPPRHAAPPAHEPRADADAGWGHAAAAAAAAAASAAGGTWAGGGGDPVPIEMRAWQPRVLS